MGNGKIPPGDTKFGAKPPNDSNLWTKSGTCNDKISGATRDSLKQTFSKTAASQNNAQNNDGTL